MTECQRVTRLEDVRRDHLIRYEFARDYIKQHGLGESVLDFGCGIGYGSTIMSEVAKKITAIDCSETNAEFHQKYFARPNIEFIVTDALEAQFDQRFSCVVCFEFLEHTHHYESLLLKISEMTDHLIISTPNELVRPHQQPPINPYHVRHFTPTELENLLRRYHFKIHETWNQKGGQQPEMRPGPAGKFIVAVASKQAAPVPLVSRPTVGVFLRERYHNQLISTVMNAVIVGLESQNIPFFVAPEQAYQPCEIAITWSVFKARTQSFERQYIHEQQKKSGKKVLVVERGYFDRNHYHSMGWGGLNGNALWLEKPVPPDRWQALNHPLLPWRTEGEHILVLGQIPWDVAVQHLDFEAWCLQTIHELKQHTSRPVVFRPHPLHPQCLANHSDVVRSSQPDLAADCQGAWAVVSVNSNSAVLAICQGIPAIVCDKGSMAWPVASHNLADIKTPLMPDRSLWLAELAYRQWTVAEIATGFPFEFLQFKQQLATAAMATL